MSRIYEALKRTPPPPQSTAIAPRTGGWTPHRPPPEHEHAHSRGGEDTLDARRLIWILFQRRRQILLVAALVVVPAVVATMLQERLYESATLIEVGAEQVQVLPYRDVAAPTVATGNPIVYMTAQEEMLKGSIVMSRVAERLEADPESAALSKEVERLGSQVSILPVPNSQMFRIGYLAARPEWAAKIANTWAEEFIKTTFASRQETREKVRNLLKRELSTLEQKVQASERELVQYAQAHGMQPDQSNRGDLAQTKLSTLSGEVTAAESELFVAQSRLDTLRNASTANFPEKLMTAGIMGRQGTLLQLEHELTALRTSFGENWPAVVQKRNEIAVVREQLEREKAAALAQAREQALLDFRAAENKRRMLGDSMTQQEQLVTDLQKASVQYNIIRREVETNQKLYEGLLERLKQTGVAPGMEFENIRIIQPALPSSTVARPRVLWNLLLASMLGLALGVCVAFARDFWGNAVSSAEEVESITGLPVLGAVPLVKLGGESRGFLPRGRDRAAESLTREGSIVPVDRGPSHEALATKFVADPGAAEAVRSICASILLSRSERPPQVLMVTSAVPGEGKSTMAGQLGLALADSGSRTLLVECDMRRPTFGSVLGVGAEGGLSLFLSGHIERPKIHPVLDGKLFVIPAGPTAPNPVALLHSEKMKRFVAEMARSFQFVILDAPPVLPMADARMLGPLAEGVVLVVRAGVTSRSLVQRACAALESTGATILGTILNGADLLGPDSSYYRYYRRYYEN